MANTNVPKVEITPNGVTVPDTPSVLAGVLLDYRDAFGETLNINSISTPQGYLAQEQTAAIMAQNAAIAEIYNGVDPAYASGRMQDAIARIYFLSRKPPSYTVVECICTGAPYGILPSGSQAKDDNGYIYESVGDATFSAQGQATVQFQCTTAGAIPVGVGELSQIAVAVSGWDAVTNEVAGATGSEAEGRSAFERRRQQSVAINSHSTTSAIFANVMNLDGVIDCYVVDNPTGQATTFGVTNYSLKPHSVVVAVEGGIDKDIANAIWERKDLGCDMNGNTTIAVTDNTYPSNNKPTYQITFLRPTNTPVDFNIKIKQSDLLPSDVITQIKEAVKRAFNGSYEGKDRERINGTIFTSKYYEPIQDVFEEMQIISILVGEEQTTLTMGVDQFPVIGNIEVELIEE